MRNRFIRITIAILSLVALEAAAREDGSRSNPFTVSNVNDLISLQKAINNGVSYHNVEINDGAEGTYFVLTQDIDLMKSDLVRKTGWKPIGTERHPFKGRFDGKGNKISYNNKKDKNLFILFGYAENAVIKNVLLDTKNGSESDIDNVCNNGVKSQVFGCAVTDTMPQGWAQFAHSTYTLHELYDIKARGYENGSEEHPFIITNEMDFLQLSKSIRGGSPFHNSEIELGGKGSHFILGADIDMKKLASYGIAKWLPIGTPTMPFRGHFSGNGHKIANLSIVSPDLSFVGLFGCIDGAVIENVELVNAKVEANFDAGLLVGYAVNSEIRGCLVDGELRGTRWLGAICGETYNTLVGTCEANCAISAGKNSYSIGGIVGEAVHKTTLYQCIVRGTVQGASSVGDICGTLEDSNIYLCSKNKIAEETNEIELVDLASILFEKQ